MSSVTGAPTQRCPRCEQDLPQAGYHPDKWGKRGHYCRPCMTEYRREWRRARGIGPCGSQVHTAPQPRPRVYSTTYRAVHKRVQRLRGRASNHPCGNCGKAAEEWAYDHSDPAPLTGATGGRRSTAAEYSADPARYVPLCKPCHSRRDRRAALERLLTELGYQRTTDPGE